MSRTKKENPWWKFRINYKSGIKKAFKKRSNKKERHTPVLQECIVKEIVEMPIKIRIPQKSYNGYKPTVKFIEVTLPVQRDRVIYVEAIPEKRDIWEIE